MGVGAMSDTSGCTIAVVAAVFAEIRPLLRRLQLEPGLGCYVGSYAGRAVVAHTSGVGESRLADALSAIIAAGKPDVIVSVGFAGALDPSLAVGDVVHVQQVLHDEGSGFDLRSPVPTKITQADKSLASGTLLTSDKIADTVEAKRKLRDAHGAAAVDMETYYIAQACASQAIGMKAVRAISDTAAQTLPAMMLGWTNAAGHAKPMTIALDLLTHPWLIPATMRIGRQSRVAGEKLADAAAKVIADEDA